MSEKYDMAARLTVLMVLEIMMARHGWVMNETISRLSKCDLYERLCDSETELWMDNPHDLADLFDKELRGERLTLGDFFK